MAKVIVKLFGVYRVDTHIANTEMQVETLADVMEKLKEIAVGENKSSIAFTDATLFINGEHCKKKRRKLNDGDEIWLLSPSSGG